jgi:hypothetical protein
MAWQRGRSFSQDLRERVLAADDLTSRQAAERFLRHQSAAAAGPHGQRFCQASRLSQVTPAGGFGGSATARG